MRLFVSQRNGRQGDGTEAVPFQTIQEAADAAMPGDEVIVLPGIYREYVNPVRGGTEERPIDRKSVV